MNNNFAKIDTKKIAEAVYNLCVTANTTLAKDTYNAILELYENETNQKAKNALALILQNARTANKTQRPLCQDTGQVIIFVELGQNVQLEGGLLEKAINDSVCKAYEENFFRKSVVKDAVFDRSNTKNNTPAIIYTEIVEGNEINISLCIKGGGSENMSAVKMLKPADGIHGIIDFAVETVLNAGSNPCPPVMLGIGIGGTMEKAAILSKKALLKSIKTPNELEQTILDKLNALNIGAAGLGGKSTAYGVSIITAPTHIASLPVAITINCHSSRHAAAKITQDEIIYTNASDYEFKEIETNNTNVKLISTNDISAIKNLQDGEEVLLSGTIYTARDAAHKNLVELIEKNEELPFDVQDKIIFYAGPCPAKEGEIIGPTGPTTATRMDKYTPQLLEKGLLAMIGKGERSQATTEAIKSHNAVYFTAIGGIASLMGQNIKAAKVIAFPELETEAIRALEVTDLPLTVAVAK